MPAPTKPTCSGSWPDPPPETSPTFPATGASARMTNPRSAKTRSPGWAADSPANASATTLSASLISFFTVTRSFPEATGGAGLVPGTGGAGPVPATQ